MQKICTKKPLCGVKVKTKTQNPFETVRVWMVRVPETVLYSVLSPPHSYCQATEKVFTTEYSNTKHVCCRRTQGQEGHQA